MRIKYMTKKRRIRSGFRRKKTISQRGGVSQYKRYDNCDVGDYRGDIVNDKRVGTGVMNYQNGDVYTGAWVNDKREGKGKMLIRDDYLVKDIMMLEERTSSEYDGDWVNDKKNGNGKLIFGSEAYYYDGKWKDNKFSGKGTMKDQFGTYVGRWDTGAKYGKGTMTYVNGDLYKGHWDEYMDGKGKMIYANGDEYEGEWAFDEKSGDGTMKYANGDVYIGYWEENMRDGLGRITYANGEVYDGEWVEDVPDINHVRVDAYQVHNFAGNINYGALNAFLKDRILPLLLPLSAPLPEKPALNTFSRFIEMSMKSIIDTSAIGNNEAVKNIMLTDLANIMQHRLRRVQYLNDVSSVISDSIFLSLEYTKLQSPTFQEIYAQTFLTETCTAYGTRGNRSIENMSCVGGTYERLIISLASAATAAMHTADEAKATEYERLHQIIALNPKTLIPLLILEWYRKYPNGVGLENKDAAQRRQNLQAYIEQDFPDRTAEIDVMIADFIKRDADPIGYEDEVFYVLGGRRKKKQTKNSNTRRLTRRQRK